ncbi:carotenoid oxygenase [Aspergillus californicus]
MSDLHYNNWPNDQGFNANTEQKSPIELTVTGSIPSYAAGTLYRTGPGRYQVGTELGNTFAVSHWFDGFSQTHRFQILSPEAPGAETRVLYNSRFSTDALVEDVRRTGGMQKFTFGGRRERDPCQVIYGKVQSTYEPGGETKSETHTKPKPKPQEKDGAQEAAYANIGVTLSVNMPGMQGTSTEPNQEQESLSGKISIHTLHAKSDNSSYKSLHPTTLEPLALSTQTAHHPSLSGPLSASHAVTDPETGDLYNYNLAFDQTPTYRVFCVSTLTGETTILATFNATPAYLHSFFLTENHVVLCIWNAHLNPRDFAKGSYIGSMREFDDSVPAKWYVVDRRHGRGIVGIYESPAFFCFHTINGWEEIGSQDSAESDVDIIAECVVYENTDVLRKLYYEYLLSDSPLPDAIPPPESRGNGGKTKSRIARFRLPAVLSTSIPIPTSSEPAGPSETANTPKATLEWTACETLSPELPTLNPLFVTNRHRYTYAAIDRGYSTLVDGIMKFDSVTRETILWSEHGQSPGEAIFVPNPEGQEEDEGVLLSVVLDGVRVKPSSYLLVLDAKTLMEVGRASVDGVVGFGFHGLHVSG